MPPGSPEATMPRRRLVRSIDGATRSCGVVDSVVEPKRHDHASFQPFLQESIMSKLPIIAVAAFFLAFAAQAAEPTTGAIKPAPAAPAAAAPKPTAAPQKAALSQQDKMRECNKQ